MKRKEPKAKFVRGAEKMFDEMWAWGEERPQPTFAEIAGKAAPLRQELKGELPRELPGELLLQHGEGGRRRQPVRTTGRR